MHYQDTVTPVRAQALSVYKPTVSWESPPGAPESPKLGRLESFPPHLQGGQGVIAMAPVSSGVLDHLEAPPSEKRPQGRVAQKIQARAAGVYRGVRTGFPPRVHDRRSHGRPAADHRARLTRTGRSSGWSGRRRIARRSTDMAINYPSPLSPTVTESTPRTPIPSSARRQTSTGSSSRS